MTKKRVTSTYRREFSPDRSACRPSIARSFGANFNYREYRRQVEHGHHRSPFVWDDWEYEQMEPLNSARSSDRCHTNKVNAVTQVSDYSSSGSDTDSANVSSSELPPPPQARVRGRRALVSTSSHSSGDCNCGVGQEMKVQGQPPRVLSDTISKSLKKVSKRSEQADVARPRSAPMCDAPFVQFGTGDDEQETGHKRTHNVLSKHGVYPAAKGARVRQDSAVELRSQQPVRPVKSKTTLHDPEFNSKMNRQTTRWQSEYNNNYRQYPTSRYH